MTIIVQLRIVLLSIVFAGMFSVALGNSEATARQEMKKLVNHKRMSKKAEAKFIDQRLAQYKSWEENAIPENFRLPIELQSYRPDGSAKFYIIYNPKYKTGVGYVPSNLAKYYEEEAYSAYKKLGKDAPSLSIVLAQQFTESAFNPYARGDNNMSCGLPQLYLQTAKYLYKADKETWKEFFYFDKSGYHRFHSFRTMIRFPFLFLPKVKQYTSQDKSEGVRRYNGAGPSAIAYAEKVMLRSLFYEELFADYNEIPLDTTGFKENLFGIINMTLLCRSNEMIDQQTMHGLFENVLATFQSGYVRNTYLSHYRIPQIEDKSLIVNVPNDFKVPVNGKDFYLEVEDGRTLYSYFRDPNTVISTLNHTKNEGYYLYLKQKSKKIIVKNRQQIKNQQVYTNVVPGDRIYIPPGTVLNEVNNNMAVFIR